MSADRRSFSTYPCATKFLKMPGNFFSIVAAQATRREPHPPEISDRIGEKSEELGLFGDLAKKRGSQLPLAGRSPPAEGEWSWDVGP